MYVEAWLPNYVWIEDLRTGSSYYDHVYWNPATHAQAPATQGLDWECISEYPQGAANNGGVADFNYVDYNTCDGDQGGNYYNFNSVYQPVYYWETPSPFGIANDYVMTAGGLNGTYDGFTVTWNNYW